jgi:alkylation response protein AidB-like acyl-CoA dehydrogenase
MAVDDGFRVSGRWSLVSGCELAHWIPVMCVITDGTEPRMLASLGVPELRMAYIPKGSYRILDTWYVGGLRGTGSHDIVVEDVLVPAERTFSIIGPKFLDRPLYRMPLGAIMSAGCASICVGIAHTAIDALLELGSSKVQVDLGPGLRDRPAVQAIVAESEAELEAARLLLHDALGELWAAGSQEMSPIGNGRECGAGRSTPRRQPSGL